MRPAASDQSYQHPSSSSGRSCGRRFSVYAASGYELLKALKDGSGQEDWGALIVAFLVSTITAFVAVKWLLGYIQTHRFTAFAMYRFVLGIILLATVASWRS
jgi:undecaprenyl-diphosphatase